MFTDIAKLSCGAYEQHDNCIEIFTNLYNVICNFEDRILELPHEDDETIRLLGPFYGRSLLENVCTTIVGRFDPFRILFVGEVQKQDSFGIASRSKSAIQWFGDIYEKGLENAELVPEKMWSSNKDFGKVGRGLLGDYYGELYWRPAFVSLLDDTNDYIGKPYLSDEIRSIPPEHFVKQTREGLSKLYSKLSKGVHSELVIRSELVFDRPTVLLLMSEVMQYCALLSLLSHKVKTTIGAMEFEDAVKRYDSIMERSERYGG
ncbi:hypothetical protein [Tumebacillus permanentifrigoris]|uniref:Uncharacterized protein n=1 Tax=Tumebacillus permanentifrigoris TaxID=378543 RepID=A0A316DXV2_9BACL|nr:hypothetical protein [Tumebacillus permanentifrigoris]PWK14941.1 hypothetical protein C7459_104143 [Tumebacillus permanentifrigoris]